MSDFFPFALDNRWKPLFLVLGVKETDGVTVTDDALEVKYGRVSISTPLDNIDHTEVSGPERWYTSVGLRLSFADDGITFGTNSRSGLCVALVEKIPAVIGRKKHSALWVSVEDPEALATRLGG